MGTRPRAEMSRPRSVRGLTPSTRPPVWHLSQRAWKAPTEKSHIACVSLENNHSRLYKVPRIRTGVWRLLGKWVRERTKMPGQAMCGPPLGHLPTDMSATDTPAHRHVCHHGGHPSDSTVWSPRCACLLWPPGAGAHHSPTS